MFKKKIIGVKCEDCQGIAIYIFDSSKTTDFDEESMGNCMICLEDHIKKINNQELKEILEENIKSLSNVIKQENIS